MWNNQTANQSAKQAAPEPSVFYHWLLLLGALALLAGFIAYSQFDNHRHIERDERERLATQAEIVEKNVAPQLLLANRVIESIVKDVPEWQARGDGFASANRQLQIINDNLIGIRPILVISADGTVVASSNQTLVGQNFAYREYFSDAVKNPDPSILHVSAPFKTVLDTYVISLFRTLRGPQGEFAGVVIVSVVPEYFSILLDSVRYASDMRVSIIHADGKRFLSSPGREGSETETQGRSFERHLKSALPANLFVETRETDGETFLVALRSIQLVSPPMDKALVVSIERNRRNLFADWQRDALIQGLLLGMLALVSSLSLLRFHHRQRAHNRLLAEQASKRERAEAELRENEDFSKALFSDSGIPMVVLDPETGRFVDCNHAAARIYRIADRESVIGLTPSAVSAPTQYDGTPSADAATAKINQALANGSNVFEWRHRRPDGSEWDAEVNLLTFRHGGRLLLQFSLQDISERKRIEDALVMNERYRRALLDNFPFMVWLKDKEGRFLAVNQRMEDAGGRGPMVGKTDFDLWPNELAELYRADDRAVVETGQSKHVEEPLFIDGKETWGETYKSPVIVDGQVMGTVGFARDISERKRAEEKLHLAASVFTHAREGIMITAADGTIVDANETFCRITGYRREEIIGQNPRLLKSGRQPDSFYAALWRDLIDKDHWYGEMWNRRKNGEIYAEMLTISAVKDAQGKTQHFVALCSDITALKEHEKQLEHIAHYDVLTTLPNRVLLVDRLHQAMAQGPRRGHLLAVAYLDLDGFKVVNDKHGHDVGDQLLVALSGRMKQVLREGDTLARLGGDEFVAVLLDLTEVESCLPMLSRLLVAAAEPIEIGDFVLQVSASLGVTFYPQAEDVDADQLLRQADQAMYQAKLAGKNRYHVFDAAQDRSVRGHHESLEHIRQALARREFVLYYQPKVNMRTGTVIGAEALIRWQHPERGLLPPAVFLPVIEEHPLAVTIGEWVIDTALSQMEAWHALGLHLPVSVNIGARQLQQSDFVEQLRARLDAHPSIQPHELELEVLETSALEDLSRVSQIIESCREIGVMFSLDDFGTGYSSLTYLKRLSVAQLKIDQSFVRDMLDDPDDLAILGGVLSLATAFRRQVIAEGVETVEHGEMLLQLGCELAQGYGIARPMPAAEMPLWVSRWVPALAWSNRPAVIHDDLPLLFAAVEHRAWMLAVEDFLKGQRGSLPLIHHQCNFETWLNTDGLTHVDQGAAFQMLEQLHRQTHEMATHLCARRARGETDLEPGSLDAFHALRDALLCQLQLIVRAR